MALETDANGNLKVTIANFEVTLDPTNLATGAKQDTGNTALAAIQTAAEAGATEATLGDVLTALNALSAAIGSVSDAAVTDPGGDGSVIAILKGILTDDNALVAGL